MTLLPLDACDMEVVREWRNAMPETLRTPYLLTEEMQYNYYKDVICDRKGTTRYWALWEMEADPELFVGYGGIENIQWENRLGEISVLIGPDLRGRGYGKAAVDEFLRRAFDELNLHAVWGECYLCSPAVGFWRNMVAYHGGIALELPYRKYWDGKYWGSLYFCFVRSV